MEDIVSYFYDRNDHQVHRSGKGKGKKVIMTMKNNDIFVDGDLLIGAIAIAVAAGFLFIREALMEKRKKRSTQRFNPLNGCDTDMTKKCSEEEEMETVLFGSSQDVVSKLNVFKSPSASFKNSVQKSGKKRQWKTLKQIISYESSLKWGIDNDDEARTYASIDGPPSFLPAKKYSDISGMEASYTDPQTKMNFAFTDEFKMIRKLPSDIVAGYLTLRRANTQLQ